MAAAPIVSYGRTLRGYWKTVKIDIPLAKLRTAHFKTWRDGLGLNAATFNRTLTALKAALNLAVQERNVVALQAQEWAEVERLKSKKKEQVYLDLAQRRAFIAAATGGTRDLIHAAILTGARPGELVKATRSQYDSRTKSMQFKRQKANICVLARCSTAHAAVG